MLAGTGEKLWLGFAPKYIKTLGGSILIIGYVLVLLWQSWLALLLGSVFSSGK